MCPERITPLISSPPPPPFFVSASPPANEEPLGECVLVTKRFHRARQCGAAENAFAARARPPTAPPPLARELHATACDMMCGGHVSCPSFYFWLRASHGCTTAAHSACKTLPCPAIACSSNTRSSQPSGGYGAPCATQLHTPGDTRPYRLSFRCMGPRSRHTRTSFHCCYNPRRAGTATVLTH